MAILKGVALCDKPGSFDVRVEAGCVTAIEASSSEGAPQWLLMPSFHNRHAHANRAFSAPPRRPESLSDAVKSAKADRATVTLKEMQLRAATLMRRSVEHGVSCLRTHTDVDMAVGMRAIDAVTAASAQEQALDVEIVAFASAAADPAAITTQALFAQAVEHGARWIGGVPALYADPRASLTALMRSARVLNVDVDLHLDEHLDIGSALISEALDVTRDLDMAGRVTLSHACVLAAMESQEVYRLLDRMHDARVALVALPELNLYLQDRGGDIPRTRGVAPVGAALRAGVDVGLGTDNVRDWFFPLGDGDMLEAGYVAALASHIDRPEELLPLICGGRSTIKAGDAADLVLIPASSFDEALARRPGGRILLRAGTPVSSESARVLSDRGVLVNGPQ